jgi:transposase-like protein
MGIKRDLATCLSCDHKQMVKHHEWIRASRPRCVACGGAVEQSTASRMEQAVQRDEKRERNARFDKNTNGRKRGT